MPSQFGRYQSGIEAATGNLVPAYGKMAEQTANTIAGFGQNLAAGIQKYQANEAEAEMINEEAKAIGSQLQQFESIFGNNPEYAPFAKQLSGYIDKVSKIPEMSLAQKRGALNGAKVAFSQIGTQLQMFNQMKALNEERAAADAMRPENNPTTEVVDKVLPMALDKFEWSKPYLGNESGFSAALDNLIKQGADIDKPAKLEEYRKRVEEAATEMSKTNPMGLTILDQVKAARKLDEATSPDTEGYSEAEQTIRTPAEQKSAVTPENLKSYFKTSDTEKELLEVQEKIKQINLRNAQGGQQIAPMGVETTGNIIESTGATLGYGSKGLETNEALRTYIQGIKASNNLKGQLEKSSIDSLVNDFYQRNTGEIASSLNIVNEAAKGFTLGSSSIAQYLNEGVRGFVPLTKGEEQAIVDASRRIASQQTGYSSDDTLNKLKIRENQLKNNLLVQKGNEQAIQKANETSVTEPKPNQLSLKPVDITVPKEVPIAPEVRNQKAIDFMTQRLGYRDASGNLVTPASVNKIFGDMGTGGVKVINNPDGSKIYRIPNDKGGYDNQFVKASEVSASDQRLAESSVYGVQDKETGKLLYEKPIKGLDIKIRGTGKFPSDKEAGNFKQLLAKSAMVVESMKRVQQIADDHPVKTKLPWTDAQVDIVSEQSKAIALMREILALDRLSDKDVQIIMARIPQNESWMRTASQTKIQANNVIKDVNRLIYNLGTIYKLDVSIEGQANSPEGKSSVKELKKELNR